jgi:DNA-binding PadR family transcriptional regulator
MARKPEALLPLKHAWLHVLMAIAGGHQHGYAIRKEVEERTQGRLRLWPATLYGTIARLCDDGLLDEVDDADATDERQRRVYRLTRFGREVLQAELRRMEGLIRDARQMAGLREPAAQRRT